MSEFSPISLARSNVSCGIATTAKTSFLDPATDKNVQGACHRRPGVLACYTRIAISVAWTFLSEFSPASLARSKVSCGIATTAKTSFLDPATSTTNVKVPVIGGMSRCLSPACYRRSPPRRSPLTTGEKGPLPRAKAQHCTTAFLHSLAINQA